MTESASDYLTGASRRELEVFEKLLKVRDIRINFASNHHLNTRGEKMDFVHYPHIRDLYGSLSREIVLQGSVQSFKSEWAVIDHFAVAMSGLSVFYVLPKFETRTTYVQNRINRVVQNVTEYKRIIGEGFFDSVAIKSFGKGVIKYVGSNVLADFKEFPGDMLVVDEVDECDQDNVEYALDRLRASKYQFKRYLGNPKIQNQGINKLFNISDKREWYVPCRACGEYHQLDWFVSVVKDNTDRDGNVVGYSLLDPDWEVGCGRDIKIICPDCGGELERASVNGEWRAQQVSQVEGYHISMLCSPINSVAEMWTKFQAAFYEPMLMQVFYNSYLGLPYNAVGNKVTVDLLDRNVEDDFNLIAEPTRAYIEGDCHEGPCSMGVDIGKVFDVRISYLEPRGHRRMVFVGKIREIDELHDLIERYNIEVCVVDSMPEITLAQDFQESASERGCDTWLCRYRSEGTDRRKNLDTRSRIINVDRTEALDRSFSQFRKQKNILPENYSSLISGEYVTEMCGPVRQIVEDTKGKQKYEWTKCKDHQRHADSYDLQACMILQDSEIIEVSIG